MYCTNCGQKLSEGTAVCPSCGAQIGRNEVVTVENSYSTNGIQVTPVNQSTVAGIYRLLEPLRKIADLNSKIATAESCKAKASQAVGNAPVYVILGGLIGVPCGWMLLIIFMGAGTGSARAILGAVIGACIGLMMVGSNKKTVEESQQNIDDLLGKVNSICGEINEEDIALLPPSYRFYNAASFFYNAFINQRALTMQQAVNLFEDEMRKDQMARIQQQQMQALGSIQKSSSVTATMTGISATIHTLDFIGRLF